MHDNVTNIEDVEYETDESTPTQPPGWDDTSAPWPFSDADIVIGDEMIGEE